MRWSTVLSLCGKLDWRGNLGSRCALQELAGALTPLPASAAPPLPKDGGFRFRDDAAMAESPRRFPPPWRRTHSWQLRHARRQRAGSYLLGLEIDQDATWNCAYTASARSTTR